MSAWPMLTFLSVTCSAAGPHGHMNRPSARMNGRAIVVVPEFR